MNAQCIAPVWWSCLNVGVLPYPPERDCVTCPWGIEPFRLPDGGSGARRLGRCMRARPPWTGWPRSRSGGSPSPLLPQHAAGRTTLSTSSTPPATWISPSRCVPFLTAGPAMLAKCLTDIWATYYPSLILQETHHIFDATPRELLRHPSVSSRSDGSSASAVSDVPLGCCTGGARTESAGRSSRAV